VVGTQTYDMDWGTPQSMMSGYGEMVSAGATPQEVAQAAQANAPFSGHTGLNVFGRTIGGLLDLVNPASAVQDVGMRALRAAGVLPSDTPTTWSGLLAKGLVEGAHVNDVLGGLYGPDMSRSLQGDLYGPGVGFPGPSGDTGGYDALAGMTGPRQPEPAVTTPPIQAPASEILAAGPPEPWAYTNRLTGQALTPEQHMDLVNAAQANYLMRTMTGGIA
jgi:hypothetical protein